MFCQPRLLQGLTDCRYDNLPACLTQLSSQGQMAFEKAEENLGTISFRTQVSLFGVNGYVCSVQVGVRN
jgi:hypothetical protein